MTLAARIAERIRREGPITFADYMAAALYDEEDGFFATGAGAGRAGGDFVTSPEVGTLFGALVARGIDQVWRSLGEPDPFVVVEAGAGRGRLAADVLRAEPACVRSLRYVLVERSPALRAAQRDLLSLEPADEALGPFARSGDAGDPDDRPEPLPGRGPIVTSLDDLPGAPVAGVVLANELLDNLPVRIAERGPASWLEVRVALGAEGQFIEAVIPAPGELAAEADDVAAGIRVPTGARLPVPTTVPDWLAAVARLLRRGAVVLVDYADEAGGLLARGPAGWIRTYRAQRRGSDPLDSPGAQDITCDVPLEYLRAAAGRAGFTVVLEDSQAGWLRALGIDELVDEGSATWRERAHLGDLEAVAGRSRAIEAAALTDSSGLGAHRVLVLRRGGSVPA